ncbi:hypothetical protein [Nonomuraea sp. SYSU D8015]|uniref:hypothetical protein n=1 Tax=Nonomuraea sp. SYSU D8015 TaxID=2593644 RepID=UPI001660D5C4|nr:hypothetical protein [Nonomuraea sp. SYSU D8015]
MTSEQSPDDGKPDIGDMIGDLLSFWMLGSIGSTSEHNLRYHPVKLVVWTLVAIAVATVVSAVKLALFGEPRAGWATTLIPLLLPLTGAVAHRPPRYASALAGGLAAGVVTALLIGIDMGTTLSSFWAGFAGVCAGFLACSVVFAAVTWPRPEPPEQPGQ